MKNIHTNLVKGDVVAIQYVYDKHYRAIENMILQNNGDHNDAKDVFQEAITSLIKNMRTGKYEKRAELGTYLYSIAKYNWLNVLKKRKYITFTDNNFEENVSTYELQQREYDNHNLEEDRINLILGKLEQLNKECRELLTYYYLDNLKHTDIAKKMQYTDQFVRVKKNRCMNELKKLVFDN